MYWKKIITAAAFVLLLFCLLLSYRSCKRPDVETKTTIRTKSDTIKIHTRDTMFVERYWKEPSKIDTFIVFENSTDTLYITGIAQDTIWIDSLNLDMHGSHTEIHDSVFIETTVYEKERFSMDIGVCVLPSINGLKSSDIGARVAFNFKGGHSVETGYNFLNKQIAISYRKRISFKKNNRKLTKN
ncbi:MAG: hypothetical protein II063_10345 [Prevotella sp.]|nr:hypothetical protein [Prevotella sp.]